MYVIYNVYKKSVYFFFLLQIRSYQMFCCCFVIKMCLKLSSLLKFDFLNQLHKPVDLWYAWWHIAENSKNLISSWGYTFSIIKSIFKYKVHTIFSVCFHSVSWELWICVGISCVWLYLKFLLKSLFIVLKIGTYLAIFCW